MAFVRLVIRLTVAIVAVVGVSSCAFDGSYRYKCQDPANWRTPECNPPICKVDGACAKDLIGFDFEEEQP
jgi:hypothetical protein